MKSNARFNQLFIFINGGENMNNNMNEQNNQGMNNTVQPNPVGTFFNNVEQPTNPVMDNNMNVLKNQMMNTNVNPVNNPAFMNNDLGNNNILSQNNVGNMPNNNIPNNNGKKFNSKIILIAVGVIVALIVLIVIISSLFKNGSSGTKKVLTCSTHHAMVGVYYDEFYKYDISDGSLKVEVTQKIDLKKSQLDGDVDKWAKEKIANTKKDCNSTDGCKFNHKYSKGNYLEITMILSGDLVNEPVKDMTVDEIYEQQKSRHENGELGSLYTCN